MRSNQESDISVNEKLILPSIGITSGSQFHADVGFGREWSG